MVFVDTSIVSRVVSAFNAQTTWTHLHTFDANKSHTHVYSLWYQLNQVTKDDKTIAEYLYHIKTILDELATGRLLMTTEDLIVKILRGLGLDY